MATTKREECVTTAGTIPTTRGWRRWPTEGLDHGSIVVAQAVQRGIVQVISAWGEGDNQTISSQRIVPPTL
jgi:hypothetical protein